MRPSYDAEHPHSATPIYDELYSEYRRLFRALPGDRSGEENLKFAGFAVRDGYPVLADRSYPPQHQAFQTYAGQSIGIPQFMPSQQTGPGLAGHHGHHAPHDPTGHHGLTAHSGAGGSADHGNQNNPSSHTGHHGHTGVTGTGHTTDPTSDGNSHAPGAGHTQGHPQNHNHTQSHGFGQGAAPLPVPAQPASAAAQFGSSQGWVAAGYLGPVPHPMPVPAPVPVMGTGFGHAPGQGAGGRHRSMLSLPPGRSGDQH
ncbi:hypothetical protein [Streptomyces sp. BE303]|uniref:hypothetical protein n=1 Tax=Streptomyces sp. BE303 TaxID=3002528 RepID=UPI002E7663E2|nr:hypothetical protein [Streptomyces sp. BE303]MED7948226.1 hypothetical protein [Streptomyces sp. BE303]